LNKSKNIFPALIAIVFAIFSLQASAQSSSIYSWASGSGNWSDHKNWTVDGTPAAKTPSKGDIVYISTADDIQIQLTENTFSEGISTTGEGEIKFTAKTNVDFQVASSFVTSEITTFSKNVKVKLAGTGSQNYLLVSDNLKNQIEFQSKKKYKDLNNLPKSGGSCPFFTITPNPVAPTCNGFNDGVASVNPIADGVGPYTYNWIGGPAAPQWNNVGAGTFTIIIFDVGQGAQCNIDVFVNEPGPLTVFSMNASPPLCADVCNGTSSPIIIGGNGGYVLNWSSGESGFNASMLCPTFTLNIEDLQGCVYDTTFTFPNPPDTIKFNAAITNVDCFGNNNGAIDVTISGGVGAFTPSWTGPNGFTATVEDISNLEPGDYTLQVEDGNNCLADTVFTITENPVLSATSTKLDNECGGAAEGSISITPSGGLPPYSYAWSGPNGFTDSGQNIANLESGLYELTITDAALCTFTTQITIDEPAEITVSFTSEDVLCAGGNSGSATATASGGTPGYTYSWEGPNMFTQVGPGITDITAGIYVVTITDASLCSILDSVEVSQPDSLNVQFTVGEITCNNGSDGSITSTITGGTVPYTTAWTGPAGFSSANPDISSLLPGSYTITVTDFNNCETIETVEIDNPQSIQISAAVTSSTCSTASDGAIDITPTGGSEPYTYAWTGPSGFSSTSQDISNRPPGTYSVTVTDANLCSALGTYTINAPAALSATFTKVNASCFGVADGSITTTPSGGTAPYSFLWLGPSGFFSTDQNISGLLGGSYSLQITDASGCAGFLSVTITQPPKINITGAVTPVSCFGGTNGAISVITNGGNPPYTFSWVGPDGFTSTTKNISGIPAGTYTLTVTDAILCTNSRVFTVNQPAEIAVDATITDVICAGDSDGGISISVSDGVAPYSFSWTGPAGFTSNSQNISNVPGGTYNLTVTDANTCSVLHSYTIIETFVISINEDITDVLCFGDSNGSIDVVIVGGAEPYVQSWIGPDGFTSTDQSITGLLPGDYTFTLSDDNGCAVNETFTVASPAELGLTIDANDISCFGNADGSLSANVTGGTPTYNYSWTGPDGFSSSQASISNLSAGVYNITVTDNNNCEISGSEEIIEPTLLEVSVDVTQPGCLVDDGELIASATGGTISIDYTYSWENEAGIEVGTASTLSNLGPGEYTIFVSDENGCIAQETILLERITFNIIAAVNHVTCIGNSDGSIELNPTNGNPPFTYSWTGPNSFVSSNALIDNLEAGQYEVVVQDAGSCSINVVYDIDQPEEIGFNPSITPETCPGEMDGSIQLALSGGTPGFLIAWTGPDGFSSNSLNITDLTPGAYTASVTDVNGCTRDTTINVGIGNDFTTVLDGTNPVCAGDPSGSINADAFPTSGFPGVFTFAWSGPGGFASVNQNISNLDAGLYIVTVTSQEGCTRQDSLELFMPDSILIDVTVTNSNCLLSDGSASVIASGGVGNLAVRWLDNNGIEIATGNEILDVPSGVYSVEVSDDAGCVIEETVTISDNSGSIDGVITSPTCAGGSDGEIDIAVVGGLAPFSYSWSDGGSFTSIDEDITGITAGEYTIIVQDDNGCVFTASFTVSDPAEIVADETISQVSCNGGDGEILLTIENAQAPVIVNWTGPDSFVATGENIANLEVGIYNYEITDANNCSIMGSVDLTAADEIIATTEIENVLCGGDSSGSIDLSVVGGVSPLTYLWTDGFDFSSNIQDIADVPAGTYTVVITDANNCSITEEYDITENPAMNAEFTIVNPDCAVDNGSITVVLSGGVITTDYFISWTDSDGNLLAPLATITDLGVGTYIFSGSDDNGCSIDTTIVLTNPDADITGLVSHEICPGSADGAIDLTVLDVAEPYTISWSGPDSFASNSEDLTGLAPGIYSYLVTGFDGCEYSGMFTVNPANAIDVASETLLSCFGQNTGSISLTVTGGNPPLAFEWTGPDGYESQTEDISNLASGVYQVTITDGNGCPQILDFEILSNPEIIADVISSDNICFGDAQGTIDLSVSGGLAPYTVEWNGPNGFTSSLPNLANLISGDYTLTISDSLGCSLDTIIAISEPEELAAQETIVSAGCSSLGSLGMIELLISGGTPGYSAAWTGPDGFTSVDFAMIDLQPGIYNYTITDANSCELIGEIEIFDVDPIELDIAIQQISCSGLDNGSANATIIGGLAPFEILWSGPNGFSSTELNIADLSGGNYTLSVSDTAGCSVSQEIEIIDPEPISIQIDETIDTDCNTSADGSISVSIIGGTEPYTFEWTGPNTFVSDQEDISSLLPGNYSLLLTDSEGCEASTDVTINFTLEISADAGADLSLCEDALPFSVLGSGLNVDQFMWRDLDGNELSDNEILIISETPGLYSYVFVGSNGLCEALDTLNVEVFVSPVADAGPDQEVFAEETFTLGGNPTSNVESTYSWSPNPTSSLDTSSPNPSGYLFESTEFVVVVTDQNGCSGADTVFVNVLPDLNVTSGFTPNNDGINDTWVIDNMELFPNNVVHVFNRWGQAVFEQKSYNSGNAWDGTFEGDKLPVGTYYYTIELNDSRFPDPFTGPITIYR